MFTKAQIYNLALQALLLSRQVVNPDTDPSNEAKVMNVQWDSALRITLADMDLDSTSSQVSLQLTHDFTQDPPPLIPQPGPLWKYAYKYPPNCVYFRRFVSHQVVDDKESHHPKRVMIWNKTKVILGNVENAIGEYIATDFPFQTISAQGAMTIAYRLAWQSAPLIVGKGARTLRTDLEKQYSVSKAEAKELDSLESFSFQRDENMSEFVKVRMS